MTMMGTMQPGFLEDTQMSLALLCLSIQLQPVFLSFPFPFLWRKKSIEDDGENQRLRGRSIPRETQVEKLGAGVGAGLGSHQLRESSVVP